jgi:putative acetyltransferase
MESEIRPEKPEDIPFIRLVHEKAFQPSSQPTIRGLGLGPISVLPEFQGQGFGPRLITNGLKACRENGYALVVVLGDPRYCGRFGFSRAKQYRLDNEYGVDEEFIVVELGAGTLGAVSGLVKYQPEFAEAEC